MVAYNLPFSLYLERQTRHRDDRIPGEAEVFEPQGMVFEIAEVNHGAAFTSRLAGLEL